MGWARKSLGAALLLGGVFCAGLSLAQVGKSEHHGVAQSLDQLTARFTRGDLVLIDATMKSPSARELKTALVYTKGLHVATATSNDFADPEYLRALAAPYDNAYLLTNAMQDVPDFRQVDGVRFTEYMFQRDASPPTKLVLRNNGVIRIFRFEPGAPHPLVLRMAFGDGKAGNSMLGTGWSKPESWGVWSNATSARIEINASTLDLTHARSVELVLSGRAFATAKAPEQRITLSIAGAPVATAIGSHPQARVELKAEIPLASFRDGRVTLDLDLPGAVSPQALGYSTDPRTLALGLERIVLSVNTDGAAPDET